MYKDGSGRTIVQILFSRKREVEGFPWLRGGQEIAKPARRNGTGRSSLSAMLAKAVAVALKGDVTAIDILPDGGVRVTSRSQSGTGEHTCIFSKETQVAYLPRGNVTYHLGLLALAEALAEKDALADLLDAWEDLLVSYEDRGYTVCEALAPAVARVSDELYYWLRYERHPPEPGNDRLEKLGVGDAAAAPPVALVDSIDPGILSDPAQFRAFRSGEPAETEFAPVTKGDRTKFRGWQLAELVESLELGMHCLLVGPTATGKSLCAFEAFERTADKKPVFVIEGHESLREFDLLGGYVPDGTGGFAWRDGVLVQAMRTGSFLFIDEANRMPTRTLNVLLGVLSRRAVVLTEHGSEEVKAEPGFQVVMAMNLGQAYAVNALDRALLDRFPCVLEFRYLPPREEEELLIAQTDIGREVARIMVKVANETRQLRRNRELVAELTPRGLIAWATKFQAKRGSMLARLKAAARSTWLHQVAGTDADGYLREEMAASLLSLIEAHTPR